jgi:hypothetical protein
MPEFTRQGLPVRVAVHAFGAYPLFVHQLIAQSRKVRDEVEWRVILSNDRHLDLMLRVLPASSIAVIDWQRKDLAPGDRFSNVHQAIDAEKRQFKRLPGAVQVQRANAAFASVVTALRDWEPTHALATGVEGVDGKAFIAAAKHLEIPILVPTSARMFGGIYFSSDEFETIPGLPPNHEHRRRAADFIDAYRSAPTTASPRISHAPSSLMIPAEPTQLKRLYGWAKRSARDPSSIEIDHVRAALLNRFPAARDRMWRTKALAKRRFHDLPRAGRPSQPYVYFPLQYSPESSINSLSPYFIDQMRVIDLVRLTLPVGMQVVVKEHPSMIGLRASSFMHQLSRKSGVLLAHVDTNSIELIRGADLTVSVTGTAVAEAYLLGRPAISLGPCLPAELAGQADLSLGVEEMLRQASSVSDEDRIASVARLLAVREEVNFLTPGLDGEPMLNPENVDRFRQALYRNLGMEGSSRMTSRPFRQ